MSEIELIAKIRSMEMELAELKGEKERKGKGRFTHSCPYCGETWQGTKENIKECQFCKRILKRVSVDTYKKCQAFDLYLKEHKHVIKELKGLNRRYIFDYREEDGLIEFIKVENDKAEKPMLVKSTYEIMKDWNLSTFFREYKIPE